MVYVNDEWDEDAMRRELAETIQRHEALARAGKLQVMEITGDLIAREYGTRLGAIIRDRGLTQEALAEQIGVTCSEVSTALGQPDESKLDTLRRIADALGIGVSKTA